MRPMDPLAAARRRSRATPVTRRSPTPRSAPGPTASPRPGRPGTAPAAGPAAPARSPGRASCGRRGDASCTITNTFIPPAQPAHLTLAKALVNTGGGTAQATDWTLTASGPTPISGHTGDAAITERRRRRRDLHARRDRAGRLQPRRLVLQRRHAHRRQPRARRRRRRELHHHQHLHTRRPAGPPDAGQVARQHGRRDGPCDGLDAHRQRPDVDLGPHR